MEWRKPRRCLRAAGLRQGPPFEIGRTFGIRRLMRFFRVDVRTAPGGDDPHRCDFSVTHANGRTTTDKSPIETWSCRDVGGNPERGNHVIRADGRDTSDTFAADGSVTVVGTDRSSYTMRWRNDSHHGRDMLALNHRDGALSWIPGHLRRLQE